MPTNQLQTRAIVAAVSLATAAAAIAFVSVPCLSDIAPESGLLAHVQPVSGSCVAPITHCSEINRTTGEGGHVEFLLFFMRGAYSWPGETICIESIDNELTWPETWQLVAFEPCGPWPEGWLVPNGVNYALHLEWMYQLLPISDQPGGVVPVARLVMNVGGPGQLAIVGRPGENPITLHHNCFGTAFVTYPAQVGAEAGMQCGYVSPHCGYRDDACQAAFDVPELVLTAHAGASADSTVGFWAPAWHNPEALCPLLVETQAPWCAAWIDPEYEYRQAYLHVTADADGLEPGMYETDLILRNDNWGSARCLPVAFIVVDEPTGIDESPPATIMGNWGRWKALYR